MEGATRRAIGLNSWPREADSSGMHRLALVLVTALATVPGCASAPAPGRPEILETALGPTLEALWRAHGDLERWRGFAAVTLGYEGRGPRDAVVLTRFLFELDDPAAVYVEEPGGEEGPGHSPWKRVELGSRVEPGDEDVDFARRSLRHLFHLPFAIAGPGWTLSFALDAGERAKVPRREFEAKPLAGGGLVGPFLVPAVEIAAIESDPHRRLERVFYLGRHPRVGSVVHEVAFSAFEEVEGIVVATAREHFRRAPGELPPPSDPFSVPRSPPFTLVWSERLREIDFLTREELEAALSSDSPPPPPSCAP
jgi:hypothetical protein